MGIKPGDIVRVKYRSTLADGTVASNDGEEPLEFIQGTSAMPGLDEGVLGHAQGDMFTVFVAAADAFGERDEAKMEKLLLEDCVRMLADIGVKDTPVAGCVVKMVDPEGAESEARVVDVGDDFVTMDFNHALAGQDITYDVEIVEVFGGVRALWRALRQDLSST